MKITSFVKKESKFTADLWSYTVATNPDGSEKNVFKFNRTISLTALTGNFGKVDVYLNDTEADVRILDQLFNLKGPDGIELQTGAVWQMDQIAPFINIWGRREGFRGRLVWIATQ
jgi:hypothetical protein